jgi:MFS family permease
MVAGVLVSIIAAASQTYAYRSVFLVGILPALLVLWIRRAVPEPEEWHVAKQQAQEAVPGIRDLFRGSVRRTTILTILVCATSLTAHWAFMFWSLQHLRNLPDVTDWSDLQKTRFVSNAMILLMVTSIAGNFLAAGIARFVGYRRSISLMCVAYFCSMYVTYSETRPHDSLFWCLCAMGVSQGLFGLFTMYMPPLFPTLLRTTGAGFCYNIGRIVAAGGTVFFGLFSTVGDHRLALLYSAWLFLPAAAIALLLSEPPDEKGTVSPTESGIDILPVLPD